MPEINLNIFNKNKIIGHTNRWDVLALLLVVGFIITLAWGAKQMAAPYQLGEKIFISLDPRYLPYYALRTMLRMAIALIISLFFTFIFGSWAAKSKHAERIIIPAVDILQSVPVLGFLAITISGFIALFPGSLLGPECAAIFVIFTAQAWNMVLGFYQSLSTIPKDLQEASDMLHLSGWQRFWRVEVPFAMPSLLWNSMMSMSAGWFFVVASEAISVANQQITLPGVGSYIAKAISEADKPAVFYAIIAMFFVILIYDQLFFRPMVAWAEKFKAESSSDDNELEPPWLTRFLQRARLIKLSNHLLVVFSDNFVNTKLFHFTKPKEKAFDRSYTTFLLIVLWYLMLASIIIYCLFAVYQFIFSHINIKESLHVLLLGFYTAIRVMILIVLATLIWVPVGVWIGQRPGIARTVQPIAQFLAAFPANLLFPIVVMLIVKYNLNVNIWTTPLMILGTQWYILFNVIAGTMTIPKELSYAIKNFNVRGWLRWKKLILPAIFPFYVTGALSAAGGAWNASIVAEFVSWGNITLHATGLGEYIAYYTNLGDQHRVVLGIVIMCFYVLIINRLVWRPLYQLAEERYQVV